MLRDSAKRAGGGAAKASLKRARPAMDIAVRVRPEAKRAYHGQDESRRKAGGGPYPPAVQYWGMNCGKK